MTFLHSALLELRIVDTFGTQLILFEFMIILADGVLYNYLKLLHDVERKEHA